MFDLSGRVALVSRRGERHGQGDCDGGGGKRAPQSSWRTSMKMESSVCRRLRSNRDTTSNQRLMLLTSYNKTT